MRARAKIVLKGPRAIAGALCERGHVMLDGELSSGITPAELTSAIAAGMVEIQAGEIVADEPIGKKAGRRLRESSGEE